MDRDREVLETDDLLWERRDAFNERDAARQISARCREVRNRLGQQGQDEVR